MASRGTLCEVCYVGHYMVDAGVLICDQCGTQSQAFQEEAHEAEGAVLGSGVRRLRQKKEKVVKAGPKDKQFQQQIEVYCACLQLQLQKQMQKLQAIAGINQTLSDTALKLWLAAVTASGCLDDDFLERVNRMYEPKPAAFGPEEDMEVVHGNFVQAVWHLLPPSTTLLISFLACWLLREALLPSDFIGWALSGHLPFMDLPAELLHLGQEDSPIALRLLRPSGLPNPSKFLLDAAKLAIKLQLPLPPVNAAGLISRFCSHLSLPQGVMLAADCLARLHLVGSRALYLPLSRSDARHDGCMQPYALVMAAVVVALGMCYDLDGCGRLPLPGVGSPPDWGVWAREQLVKADRALAWPLSPNEAGRLTDQELLAYLQHLQGGILKGNKVPEPLAAVQELLDMKADAWKSVVQQQISRQNEQTTAPEQHVRLRADPDQPDQSTKDARPQAPVTARQYRLHRQAHASVPLAAHPDYVSVLTACAAHLWIKPLMLHAYVCQLEEQMALAEATLAERGPSGA